METKITVTASDHEELRIKSSYEHLWLRPPKTLRDHFDTQRKGVFEIAPPCFEYEINDDRLSFTFKWGTDLNNIDTPLNDRGISEHLWVKSIKGLKYIHPSRKFNKIMKHQYEGLFEQQHFTHEWDDSGDIVSLTISWDLRNYTPPKAL